MPNPKRFAAIGECMLELSPQEDGRYAMGFAGDTYNVAVYLARCSSPEDIVVEYVSALGDDPYSEQMMAAWQQERVGHALVQRLPGKMPGLYVIHNDQVGERSFYYYRAQSAARFMFKCEHTEAFCASLERCDFLYFSAITLAILDDDSRAVLSQTLARARSKGAVICFDTNYRTKLWSSKELAQTVVTQFLSTVDIALPSFDDEQTLFGDADMDAVAQRFHAQGVKEVVVKKGSFGYLLSTPESRKTVQVDSVKKVVDATSAGDSFNGAYLAGRFSGLNREDAAEKAARVAAEVIAHRGAIIEKRFMPKD